MEYVRELKYNWRLYKLGKLMSNSYFNNYQNHSELELTQEWCNKWNGTDYSCNINNILNSNQIVYGNVKKKIWSFIDFIDNKEYQVFNIIMLSHHIIIYFFNINNPCFLIQNYCYMDFFYFGRIKKKNLIQISVSTSGNELDLPVIENNLDFIYNVGIKNNFINFKKQMYFFGMLSNVGHHLFNELSGLIHFINNKKNITLIDGVIIGPYDFFNTETYLNTVHNIKTIKFEVVHFPVSLTIYPVLMNSVMLDNNCKTTIKEILDYKPQNTICLHNKKKLFVFDIRTFSRVILNITETFSFIINKIYELLGNKYIINIVFTGRFLTNLNDIDILTDKEVIYQNNIVNNIINNCKYTNIIFDNLIGKKFNYIINYVSNADLMIVIYGTSAPNLINWICNTKVFGFVQPINYNIYKSHFDVLEMKNVHDVSNNCFKTLNNNDIIVNPKLFYEFLCDKYLFTL